MAEDCIFCKIVKGEIPCAKIYEDEETVAFLDIAPINPGHALVIPKQHYKDFLELPEAMTAKLFAVARKLVPAVVKASKADAYNLGMNNGKEAGQVIFHMHLHIVPRFKGDGLEHWPGKQYEGNAMRAMKEEIVAWLKKEG
ncbi:HIT family protein [Candidatus Woesearchaeota archaeon]|nr:HIT family protein [Candidatus Woesearchaeota archaeon]